MFHSSQRGFTLGEVLMITSLFSLVGTGVMKIVPHDKDGARTGEEVYRQMVVDGQEAVDQMVRELRLLGYPAPDAETIDSDTSPQPFGFSHSHSNQVAAPGFLVATAHQVIFEADLDNDGSVERIEYRLNGNQLERSARPKNPNGTIPPSTFETLVSNVDNGNIRVFTYDGDELGELPAPRQPSSVRVLLLLRTPVRDPKLKRNRTVGLEGIAILSPEPDTAPGLQATLPDPVVAPGTDAGELVTGAVEEKAAAEPVAESFAVLSNQARSEKKIVQK